MTKVKLLLDGELGSLIVRAKNSADRRKLTKLVEYFLNT